MKLPKWRNKYAAPTGTTPEEQQKQEALHHLVGLYPSEYVQLAIKHFNELPNGGSRLPWRYSKQINQALNAADDELITNHPFEWRALQDVIRMRTITPEDLIGSTE